MEPIVSSESDRRPTRRELDTDDPALIRRYLNSVYRADLRLEVLDAGHRRPSLGHVRLEGEGFAVEDVRHEGDVETRVDGCTSVIVMWVKRGRVESTVRGATVVAGPGEIVLASTGHASVRLRSTDATVRTAVLDRGLVERVAADEGVRWRPVRFTGIAPMSPEASRVWTSAYGYVADTVMPDENSSLIVTAASRLLAASVLSAFPTENGLGVTTDPQLVYPAVMRRAITYIEEHAPREITVHDIAQAVYVTPRALQYMFRRHLDTTPMAYLRRVRLDRAHHELLRNDRTTTTVAATAARWGFAHTGRFAVLYRSTYGRSPHVTLRG
jgi:AraC-like DNA-binding protein